jgi:hypothetical protein
MKFSSPQMIYIHSFLIELYINNQMRMVADNILILKYIQEWKLEDWRIREL